MTQSLMFANVGELSRVKTRLSATCSSRVVERTKATRARNWVCEKHRSDFRLISFYTQRTRLHMTAELSFLEQSYTGSWVSFCFMGDLDVTNLLVAIIFLVLR